MAIQPVTNSRTPCPMLARLAGIPPALQGRAVAGGLGQLNTGLWRWLLVAAVALAVYFLIRETRRRSYRRRVMRRLRS